MWDTDGEPEPGSGGGFLLLSTFLLVALMSYQILVVCGASPGQPSSQTRSILSLKNDQFPLVASPENKIIFRAYLRALKWNRIDISTRSGQNLLSTFSFIYINSSWLRVWVYCRSSCKCSVWFSISNMLSWRHQHQLPASAVDFFNFDINVHRAFCVQKHTDKSKCLL